MQPLLYLFLSRIFVIIAGNVTTFIAGDAKVGAAVEAERGAVTRRRARPRGALTAARARAARAPCAAPGTSPPPPQNTK